ncbi:hypothetical protein ACWT_6100 [Actinoplanes sp. SE50]|uniref:PqqD family protein n=1 Tax=unclassified Actinoplanes TaxID=2626549 RepID=UPI00023ECBA5|nr:MULTISPECIES: PqqD family protein [unclassified Actinoplanes]AEV87117.1 yxbA-like uncharacterized protein [Actinoplanes sp. SE50/110]ATO85515.1 hypothetical protein ACWT_6100 [Actinoplanes sp. SE50]SLM02927.1 hypothetical protein ACSP50_6212 [Actinoplanes sp. SE50/110]
MATAGTLTAQSVVQRASGARFRKFRGKLFVANASLAFELDEIAEFIFRQVDGESSVEAIGAKVAAEYDVDVAEAVADSLELLSQLAQNDMVHSV